MEKLCGEHRIPFFLTEADVRQRSILEKCSEEEAGRRTRYEAFDKAAEEWGATKIAVAHNSNDRSETQLFSPVPGQRHPGTGKHPPGERSDHTTDPVPGEMGDRGLFNTTGNFLL